MVCSVCPYAAECCDAIVISHPHSLSMVSLHKGSKQHTAQELESAVKASCIHDVGHLGVRVS